MRGNQLVPDDEWQQTSVVYDFPEDELMFGVGLDIHGEGDAGCVVVDDAVLLRTRDAGP
jgi:hypothetical protein